MKFSSRKKKLGKRKRSRRLLMESVDWSIIERSTRCVVSLPLYSIVFTAVAANISCGVGVGFLFLLFVQNPDKLFFAELEFFSCFFFTRKSKSYQYRKKKKKKRKREKYIRSHLCTSTNSVYQKAKVRIDVRVRTPIVYEYDSYIPGTYEYDRCSKLWYHLILTTSTR